LSLILSQKKTQESKIRNQGNKSRTQNNNRKKGISWITIKRLINGISLSGALKLSLGKFISRDHLAVIMAIRARGLPGGTRKSCAGGQRGNCSRGKINVNRNCQEVAESVSTD